MLNNVKDIKKLSKASSMLEEALALIKKAENVMGGLDLGRTSLKRSLLWSQMNEYTDIDDVEKAEETLQRVVRGMQSVLFTRANWALEFSEKNLTLDSPVETSSDELQLLRQIVGTAPIQEVRPQILEMFREYDKKEESPVEDRNTEDWWCTATSSSLQKTLESLISMEYLESLSHNNFAHLHWCICNEVFSASWRPKVEWGHDIFVDLSKPADVTYLRNTLSRYISVVILHTHVFA